MVVLFSDEERCLVSGRGSCLEVLEGGPRGEMSGLFEREGVRVASWRESSSGRMNPQSSFGFQKRGY